MSKPDQGKGIKFQPSKDYEKMIQLQLKYLPKQLQEELKYRQEYDPQFIEQALGLQHTYDPALAGEQLAAVQRRDPEWFATHAALGQKVQDVLAKGHLGEYAVDPRYEKAYGALAGDVTGQQLRGRTASPDTLRQMTQAIMSRSPNLSYGEAQDMATAVYTGQRSEALGQQRQQATGQFLGLTDPNRLAQASELQGLGIAGTYLSTPTVTSMINQTSGVNPPRAFGYVNPNAGQQGLQLGLQAQQFQYANQALQGGGGNPWTNALQGASQGANFGSVGGGYGAAGGAITGGIMGAFGYPQYSDARQKNNISRTGDKTPDGIPIVEYDYNGKRWRGVTAQDTQKVRPDAVYHFGDGRLGVFYSRIGVELEEVDNGSR